MALSISITSGFITNSSSVIYNFPNELLELPKVQALFRYFGINKETGVMPEDIWYRSYSCDTIAFTKEQKQFVANQVGDEGWAGSVLPLLAVDDDSSFAMVACDESGSYVHRLILTLDKIAGEHNMRVSSDSFN